MGGGEPGRIWLPGIPPGGLAGRDGDVAVVRRMLGHGRLVMITGLPGVGKTAVAVAAAAASAAGFPDGAWLVPLESVRDGRLVPDAVAGALGRPGPLAGGWPDGLAGELRGRRLLLVLDTCEHLLGACADLVMAMLAPPYQGIRILVTSREVLRVPGGLAVPVGPLPLHHAVAVFGQRAAECAPGFRVTAENRAAVEEICLRLDRLPLGIQLAARQLSCGSLERLRSRLAADYSLLRQPADARGRHESLRAAIDWSRQLCSPAEQLLWARLSLFPGSFGMQEAYDACAGSRLRGPAVAAGVPALVARSILMMDFEPDGHARFRLPQTIRAFGAGMLRALGDTGPGRRRQAGHRDHQKDARPS